MTVDYELQALLFKIGLTVFIVFGGWSAGVMYRNKNYPVMGLAISVALVNAIYLADWVAKT